MHVDIRSLVTVLPDQQIEMVPGSTLRGTLAAPAPWYAYVGDDRVIVGYGAHVKISVNADSVSFGAGGSFHIEPHQVFHGSEKESFTNAEKRPLYSEAENRLRLMLRELRQETKRAAKEEAKRERRRKADEAQKALEAEQAEKAAAEKAAAEKAKKAKPADPPEDDPAE